MKTQKEILNQLKILIEEQTLGGYTEDQIADDAKMRDDLGLDSLDYATVFLSCEKWLNIKVKESGIDWSKIQTLNLLAQLLESQQ